MDNQNYQGVILGKTPRDFILGNQITQEVNCDNWEFYLIDSKWKIEHESQFYLHQNRFGFETSACFPYNAMVLMEDLTYKRISEIKVGDYVISHKGKKQKVLNTMKRSNNDEMVVIKASGIDGDIISTKEHPFFTEKGWLEAKDLKEEDYLLEPLNNDYKKDASIYEIEKNKDFLWFIGLFLAEGNFGKKSSEYKSIDNNRAKVSGSGDGSGAIIFSLNKNETYYQSEIIRIGQELLDTKFTIYIKDNKASVIGYNYHLKQLLFELCGSGCYNKDINKRLMLLEPSLQLNILRGWLDGDGHLSFQSGVISGVTASEKLIKKMSIICNRNEIKNSVRYRKPYINTCSHKEAWEIFIHGHYINNIYKNSVNNDIFLNDLVEIDGTKYFKRKVKKIEIKKKVILLRGGKSSNCVNRVYNIEVENDNSYIVNRVAVHNCTLFSGNDVKELIMMWALHNNLIPASTAKWLKDNDYFKNGVINYDDRIPAMYSDITNLIGTYQWKAANALREWNLPQGILTDDPKDFNEYMDKNKITDDIIKLKDEHNKRLIWHWFWFRDDQDIDEQMKMSPSMSIVRFANGEGCLSPTGQFNHAVMEYGKDEAGCRKIDDSYNQQLKKYKPTHITSRLGFRLTIIKDNIMDVNKFLTDNDLKVIWNNETGAYAFIQQKMAKVIQTKDRDVLALFEMRFRADGKINVNNEQWNLLPKGIF